MFGQSRIWVVGKGMGRGKVFFFGGGGLDVSI
jgi:hypothetical protein